MRIGVSATASERHGDIALVARKIEELGFESMWLPEHPVIPANHNTKYGGTSDGSIPQGMYHQVNPFIALARASATTETLKLGTGICLVTEHNPLDLAKQISTLDHYSGGRFLFGIGTGWFREESEVMGADFDHRWTQAREHVLAMKELWTKEEAEFHGTYVDFPPVHCNPKPAQQPHPPVMLGGNAKNVLQRVVRWADGWMPIGVTPEDIKRLAPPSPSWPSWREGTRTPSASLSSASRRTGTLLASLRRLGPIGFCCDWLGMTRPGYWPTRKPRPKRCWVRTPGLSEIRTVPSCLTQQDGYPRAC